MIDRVILIDNGRIPWFPGVRTQYTVLLSGTRFLRVLYAAMHLWIVLFSVLLLVISAV